MGFAIGKSPHETMERRAINQIKLELKEQFQQQPSSLLDLQRRYPGESRLFLLYDDVEARAIHLNLVYALLELYQQNQLRVIDRNPVRFRIEP